MEQRNHGGCGTPEDYNEKPTQTLYPECDKLLKVSEKSAVLSEFIEWMETQNISLTKSFTESEGGGHAFFSGSYEHLFADFFGINLMKVEEERRDMLAETAGL